MVVWKMTIKKCVTELVGNTPLVELVNYGKQNKLQAKIFAKVEGFNPAGSVKDRIALAMVDDAERKGKLSKGSVLVEPTSGNTGIGLAMVAAARGYRLILTMPETMSIERQQLLKSYGAELVLTDGKKSMLGSIEKAKELVKTTSGAIMLGQFDNPANPRAHEETTGPEIWKDTHGKIDAFICGVGTGGTISGVGRYLKSKNPKTKIIGVEPDTYPHGIQGIGPGFTPSILDKSVIDEIIKVKTKDSITTSKAVTKSDGLFVGISSGAVLWAATQVARSRTCAYKEIVVVFPDFGERYLSILGGKDD